MKTARPARTLALIFLLALVVAATPALAQETETTGGEETISSTQPIRSGTCRAPRPRPTRRRPASRSSTSSPPSGARPATT